MVKIPPTPGFNPDYPANHFRELQYLATKLRKYADRCYELSAGVADMEDEIGNNFAAVEIAAQEIEKYALVRLTEALRQQRRR